jgi:hypothetical protein
MIYAMTGFPVKTLSDMKVALGMAKEQLHPEPEEHLWKPYLGEALDSGMATLFAEEIIMALRYINGLEPVVDQRGDIELAGLEEAGELGRDTGALVEAQARPADVLDVAQIETVNSPFRASQPLRPMVTTLTSLPSVRSLRMWSRAPRCVEAVEAAGETAIGRHR